MTGREPRGDESHASQASQSAYWAKLYEQCHRQLRAYFARNVRCAHDADDLVQEVFASLLLRGGRLQEPMCLRCRRAPVGRAIQSPHRPSARRRPAPPAS
ncbi:MAG: sigma-70 family RNA polymerase sigma factor [Phycisphaerae bacterium]|nr:sigma-70 family RNA polymerase sigma factor [Phycisphaerae bacterium]